MWIAELLMDELTDEVHGARPVTAADEWIHKNRMAALPYYVQKSMSLLRIKNQIVKEQ